MRKRFSVKSVAGVVAVLSLATVAPGCALIGDLLSLLGLSILGVNPAQNFTQTGEMEFSLVGQAEDGSHVNSGFGNSITFLVENEDGTMTECDVLDEETIAASEFNTVGVVLDSSGSMENTYPVDEYGDLCTTCPHDASRLRISAASDLIRTLGMNSPDSMLGVMEFGPAPSPGYTVTNVLSDFTLDSGQALAAVELAAGDEMVGTPLWDSLAELIVAADDDATAYEGILRTQGRSPEAPGDRSCEAPGNPDGEDGRDDCPADEEPVDEEPVVEDPVVEDPVVEDPVVEDPVVEDPVVEDPVDEDPVVEDPVVEDPVDEDPVVEDPVVEEPVVEEPVDAEPIPDATVRRILVVISDGDDLDSLEHNLDSVIALAQDRDVIIHAIGLGPASASDALARSAATVLNLQRLADETGGYYASAQDATALVQLYNDIAASLTEGYARETVSCIPEGFDGQPANVESGDVVEGALQVGQIQIPWSTIAP